MQLVPNSFGTFAEYNHCHNPEGAGGGQFCGDRDAFVPAPRETPVDRLAAPYGAHAATLREVHREIVRRAADGNEHLALVQPDGVPRYYTSGSAKVVEISGDRALIDNLKANPTVISVHNHPNGSAPSSQDLRSAVSLGTTRELIVGSHGEWYELEITDMAKAKAAVFEGRRRATYWESGTKGKFETAFNKLRQAVAKEAVELTSEYARKTFGWKPHRLFGKVPGFWVPKDATDDPAGGNERFIDYKEAGRHRPELAAYHSARFAELSPRIWIKLAERHKEWLTFRYHRSTGPYATTTHH